MKTTNIFDANQHAVINIPLDPRGQHHADPKEGQLYTNLTDGYLWSYTKGEWHRQGRLNFITNDGGGLDISTDKDLVNIDIDVDDATIEISSNGIRIKDSGVTTPKIADSAVTSIKVMDKHITFSKINDIPTMTVIGRVQGGNGVSSAIPIINTNDLEGADGQSLVTSGAAKAYVDAMYATLGRPRGSWDANANNVFPGDSETKNGDYWRVSVAGTIQGQIFQVGDVIEAAKNNPVNTNPNDYGFYQTNVDQATTAILGLVMLATNAEVQEGKNNTKAITPEGFSSRTATETRTGIARIPTDAEAIDGNDNTTMMTPAKVKLVMTQISNKGYSALFGNNAANEFFLSHNLNTKNLIAEFFEEPSGNKVLVDYVIVDNMQIGVYFGRPPGIDKIKVVIIPMG